MGCYANGLRGLIKECVVSAGLEAISKIKEVNAAYGEAAKTLATRRVPTPAAQPVSAPVSPSAEREPDVFQPPRQTDAGAADKLRDMQDAREDAARRAEDLPRLVEETNSSLALNSRSLRFRINDQTDELQIQVIDANRDKVIRSIPSDEMITLASRMRELSGLGAMVDLSR